MTGLLERAGVRWLLAGGLASGLGGIVLGETLLRPAHQVLYSGSLSVANCAPVAGRPQCTFQYRLSVGNTGKEKQDLVRIELPAAPPRATLGTKVSDIIASARKTPQAQVRRESATGSNAFIVSGLEPNTVVDIELFCALCEPADLDGMRAIRATVEARGSVTESDPRVSTFKNGIVNFLRVFGLFR